MKTLLIVDPQNDFCTKKGSLYVDGADSDMRRLSSFIRKNKAKIDSILVTLDMHHQRSIFHPTYWLRKTDGLYPDVFSVISLDQVMSEEIAPINKSNSSWVLYYLQELQKLGKSLVIWPEHCLIGTEGSLVEKHLMHELLQWELFRRKSVKFFMKGMDPQVERYSVVKNDIRVLGDNNVDLSFLEEIRCSDKVWVAGEASSHCVAATVRDIEECFPGSAKKMDLLADATSPVKEFEILERDFMEEMLKKGMSVSSTRFGGK